MNIDNMNNIDDFDDELNDIFISAETTPDTDTDTDSETKANPDTDNEIRPNIDNEEEDTDEQEDDDDEEEDEDEDDDEEEDEDEDEDEDEKDKKEEEVIKPNKRKQQVIDFDNMNKDNIIEYINKLKDDTNVKNYYAFLNQKNELETEALIEINNKYSNLYPHILDPLFNLKIAQKKEFNDLYYDEELKDVKTYGDDLCNAEFELSTHQIFIRNYLSYNTPYKSLLLYHGLGSGKTCSAISVCEEMRDYMKQMGIKKKIIIVASPNVQENFKLQLFDERKLKEVNGIWTLKGCTGSRFLKEINPTNMKGLRREVIIRQIKKIMNDYYTFMGYIEFSNYISRLKTGVLKLYKEKDIRDKKLKIEVYKEFSNRLLVIDEVHNIRSGGSGVNKDVEQNFLDIVKYSENLKLLFLSATPMFNSYKEIIWLLNLMNMNDKRPRIYTHDIFDKNGNLKIKDGKEVGKEILLRKSRGYVSFIRGENPYSFPYRIYPSIFNLERTIFSKNFSYPSKQINNNEIKEPMELIDMYLTKIDDYQRNVYEYSINEIRKNLPDDADLETGLGWQKVETPLQSLNIVYPHERIDDYIENPDEIKLNVNEFIGQSGLNNIMIYNNKTKRDYKYREKVLNKYGSIFHESKLEKYSHKIYNVIQNIKKSKGIVLIYSQYIDGGCVPLALALEEMGITRYGDIGSLFETPPVPAIDAITMKEREESIKIRGEFKPAKYIMITGDIKLSPKNNYEINASTNDSNKYGEDVKVIIISKTGTEGIDFKNIRQTHIIEPWYNMSRIEQIIGRSVRFCSHKGLPYSERNVEIYLYATEPYSSYEPIDMYIYRNAEYKVKQIGEVSRLLKENAVDCMININYSKLTSENLNQTVKQVLSSGLEIDYSVGDKPFTQICDYMEKCEYKCRPDVDLKDADINVDTYDENFIAFNIEKLVNKIKKLFKERYIYKKEDLIKELTYMKKYPLIQINSALEVLIKDKNEYINDVLGRNGYLVNIGDYYMFQPAELDNKYISHYDRNKPIEYKREKLLLDLGKEIKENILQFKDDIEDDAEDIRDITISKKDYMKRFGIKDSESDVKQQDKYKDGITKVIEKGVEIEETKEAETTKRETKRETGETISKVSKSKTKKQSDIQKYISMIEDYYNLTTKPEKNKKVDWYSNAALTIDRLSKKGVISKEKMLEYVVAHIIDTVDYKKKKEIVLYLENSSKDELTDFERKLQKYINNNIKLEGDDITAYIFINNEIKTDILKLSDDKTNLIKLEPLEFQDIIKSSSIRNKLFKLHKYNDLVGFMSIIENTGEIVFKIKDIDAKRNKGARCDQAGKANILKLLNRVLGEEKYTSSNTRGIKVPELCSEIEFIMRYYQDTNKDGKVWFLPLDSAYLNEIEKITRFVKK